ncbi:uncharacterized protein LOC127252870 isoform X1 [Andrographis paniculata]|uniref:uncharacterized protein LOC127252870 isoform X1 n=1 Tax=Andrographis paniculata TaxID=175694 RepID=UPI0021E8414E|nr:uncharacterized protein LOC127252870 isoform X1 [Andrographis paniculata]
MRSSAVWPDSYASAAAATAPSSSSSNFQQLLHQPSVPAQESNSCQSNVFKLLVQRELSPQTKRAPKKFWGKACNSRMKNVLAKDARQEIRSWVEAKSLLHLSAKYCPLVPPPRSTIAAAFSPDGKKLASTHGDHTVKIIDCQTGQCLKVLSGHRRTPWVVRFHPIYPEILASGSLDHEVRLWDATTAECIGSRDFYRPIASIAFHAQGEILAVASGHKLYIWHYNRRGDASSPTIILKTRRSLRAVHFHPHGAPFLLTAEVNDLDSSDPSMTLATSPGYLRYPPPTIYLADPHSTSRPNSGNELPVMSIPFLVWPSLGRVDTGLLSQQTDADVISSVPQPRRESSTSVRLLTYSTPSGQYELVLSPIQSPVREETQINSLTREMDGSISQHAVDPMETDVQQEEGSNQNISFSDPEYWEVPFLQGWLIGQSQAGQYAIQSQNGGMTEGLSSYAAIGNPSSVNPPAFQDVGISRIFERIGSRQRSSRSRQRSIAGSSDGATFHGIPSDANAQPFMNQVQSEVANSLAAAAAAELPCTVKLRIWSHDLKNPCAPLDTHRCRLTIPHAVLCSEMGAHFSPCGRFLAVCVACILPNIESDPGLNGQAHHDVTAASTSPTRHPISAHQVMYELRIYSLEEATFGFVLASRAIRAAHCLTSIQFSPTSEHLLLAYGRRHSSLLKSVVIDGDSTVPIYTILEVYRVFDMELVRVLPSAEDEVNVACFHPSIGGGFVYGTKEGKLRILHCNESHGFSNEGSCGTDDSRFEVETFALEG